MQNLARLVLLLAVAWTATLLSAQGPSTHVATPSTGFGVLADLGGTTDFASEPSGAALGQRVAIGARSGSPTRPSGWAAAGTQLTQFATATRGSGVAITEHGFVVNNDPSRSAQAGTSADEPGTARPTLAAHGLELAYATIAPGSAAMVLVEFSGDARGGASAGATLDVDGDGVADFVARADGTTTTARLPVTAGRAGVTVRVRSVGFAGVRATGRAQYQTTLRVSVVERAMPRSCSFTNFGRPCGVDLSGAVARNLDLTLDVTNAPPSSLGFLLIGDSSATPRPLPFGNCGLLLQPRTMGSRMFRTDAVGGAAVTVRPPRMPLTVSFQALVLSFDRLTQSPVLAASNGTELLCR